MTPGPDRARAVALGVGSGAVVFGLVTLLVGGSVVFDVGGARADHGDYIPFVLYFHFLSGFAYVAAGAGVALRRRWAALVATAIAVGIAVTNVALAVHVAAGRPFESETVVATTLRLVVWTAVAAFAWRDTRAPVASS